LRTGDHNSRQPIEPRYTLVERGEVKNFPYGQAFAINESGVVVGVAGNPSDFTTRATIARNGVSYRHATLWQNDDIYDLNELVSNLPAG
jgi:hypothetical protein